jgi:hypothetical protein
MRAAAEIDSSVVRRRPGIPVFANVVWMFDAAMRGFPGLKRADV